MASAVSRASLQLSWRGQVTGSNVVLSYRLRRLAFQVHQAQATLAFRPQRGVSGPAALGSSSALTQCRTHTRGTSTGARARATTRTYTVRIKRTRSLEYSEYGSIVEAGVLEYRYRTIDSTLWLAIHRIVYRRIRRGVYRRAVSYQY